MRRDDHVVVSRVEDDLVDRHRRHVRLDARPRTAAVRADEQAELRSGIQHVRILRVLGHRHDGVALGNALTDRAEVVAAVDAGIHVNVHVVGAMIVEARVDHVDVVHGRHQARHVGVLRHAREAGRDVGPGLAAILRHVDLAIVRAGIEHAGGPGRLDELHDVAVGLDTVVLGNLELFGLDVHQRQRFAVGRLGEFAADRRPRVAAVGGLEHLVGADVNRVRVVR